MTELPNKPTRKITDDPYGAAILIRRLVMEQGLVYWRRYLLAFALMAFNLQEFVLTSISRQLDDPMLAGDFGAGGSSWNSEEEEERRPGMIERWRRKRAVQRQQREDAERAETERKLDVLLEKVHREGMNSLSEPEKKFLARASARYRSHEH